jgi:hypothetical protein
MELILDIGFHVIGIVIKYEQLIIFSFYEKFIFHWCMTSLIRSMELLCFLIFKLSI